jgi:penicillin-binding protein 2
VQVNLFNNIKDFLANIFKSRLNVLIALFCILSFVVLQRLFVLQIVNGEDYLENYTLSIRKTKVIQGTRGNIYDRDGEILATNRLAYSVQIEDNGSYDSREQKNELINDTINTVIDMVEANGDTIVNDFGIVLGTDGQYKFLHAEGTRRLRFLADVYGFRTIDELKKNKLDSSTEQEVIDFLCANKRKSDYGFGIDQSAYSKNRVLQLVTIRYGMHLNSFQKYIETTIASDVSKETVAAIKENMYNLQGVSIGEESLREYPDSKYFASILGYTGKISQEEYDELTKEQQKKYSLTDIVGKAGIEQVMDEYLQGTKGEEIVYVNNVGKVIETEKTVEPKAGNDVYLTIDKELQITTYKLIEEKLAGIILRKMYPMLDYTRDPNGKSANVIIPIGDIYYAFIGNEILDVAQFAEEDATSTEKRVYSLYTKRLDSSITKIIQNLESSKSPTYKNSPKEMQAYLNYIADTLLTNAGVLKKSEIDTKDSVYTAWQNETINLNQYLNHAISKNWIDASLIQNYINSDEEYSDSNELYRGILNYIADELKTDVNFEKLVYRYMIKDGTLSGNMICILLYDQGVLKYNQTQYNQLLSGGSAYNFIRSKIESLEITPGQLGVEPSTGSCVMTETATGNTLVCVSYPGYDNNRLANSMDVNYYNQLYANSALPFYNKATQELTAPGSTFKPLSSIAGLSEGVISGSSIIGCSGPYKNITPSPTCWIHPGGHGSLNVVNAIAHSCNNYFYEVGFRLGLNDKGNYSSNQGLQNLSKYATMFGLSDVSGLELPERTPNISNEDAVRSAIGQGTNVYSTSQLTKYIAGVANKGTVYDLTLLNKVVDKNGKTIKQYKPKLFNEVTEVSDNTYNLVHQGMVSMIARDARFQSVRNGGITMAGKTGTAQQSNAHADHVLFVGFAPSTQPEIALSVRIANGYSSGYPTEIARDVVRKYYNLATDAQLIMGKAGVLGTETHTD